MKLDVLDIVIILVYLAGTVAFGSWFVRKNRNPEAFMAANRSLGGWVVGLSIVGTYISSISFLANPGKSFMSDWNPFVFSLSIPLAAWIAVRYFVPFYRKAGEISAYHHMEERFGPWARTYTVIMYLIIQVARVATVTYLVALTLSEFIGLNIELIIIITGALVTMYTLLGGIEGVIWTDAIQAVILVLGIVITIVMLLVYIPGGAGHLLSIAAKHHKFSLGSFGSSIAKPTFWVVLVYGITINLQNFGINQGFVQRYATARSDHEAKKSVWIGALSYLPISALLFFIGTALFVFYTLQPALLPGNISGDAVYPFFIINQLPVGVIGIVIAAIFAAAMSTLSSSLNSQATLTLQDIYRRYFRTRASNKESMGILYAATLFWGILGTVSALLLVGVHSALDAWWKMQGIFSGGMLGLFLLGIMTRAKNPAAISGVILGIISIVWMTISPDWTGELAKFKSPFHSFLIIVIATLVILLVGILVNRIRANAGREQYMVKSDNP